MKAIRIHAPRQFQLDDISYPEIEGDDVLVEVKACGVCGSDIAYIDAGVSSFIKKPDGPSALGHEAAGKVIALGTNVTGLEIGDRVVINPMDNVIPNMIGNGAPEGAFAEVLKVSNAGQDGRLLKMPQHLPYEIAALAEPMGVALHAVNRASVKPSSKVTVFGVGPIGLGVVIWLKHKGVENVVAVDLSVERLERARQFGADGIIQAGTEDVRKRLIDLHGKNIGGKPDTDIFIDAAGSPAALTEIIKFAKFAAALTVVAVYKSPVSVDLCTMLTKEMKLVTAMGYPTELEEVVSFLAANVDLMHNYISDYFVLGEFQNAIKRARETSVSKVMIRIGS